MLAINVIDGVITFILALVAFVLLVSFCCDVHSGRKMRKSCEVQVSLHEFLVLTKADPENWEQTKNKSGEPYFLYTVNPNRKISVTFKSGVVYTFYWLLQYIEQMLSDHKQRKQEDMESKLELFQSVKRGSQRRVEAAQEKIAKAKDEVLQQIKAAYDAGVRGEEFNADSAELLKIIEVDTYPEREVHKLILNWER